MAGVSRPTFTKRQREQKRDEKRAQKIEKQKARKAERGDKDSTEAGEDPDIAGIVAGPQPVQEE
jgi:hypothetical protein